MTRDMAHLGVKRLDVFLRATANGRFRWFHADGRPTVVDGASVEQAMRVAQLVWRDLALEDAAAPPSRAGHAHD
ncbi:MAG: hypothetical protein AB7O97_16665 [Planctomycetota bacterium]